MGYKLTFILAEETSILELCDLVGMKAAGFYKEKVGGYRPVMDSFIMGAELPSGFALITVSESNSRLLNKDCLQAASRSCRVIYGTLNEGVDCCRVAEWLNGEELWSIDHDGCVNDSRHLSVSGTPPEMFEVFRARAFADQDAEDRKAEPEGCFIFDIAIDLVDYITGYRYYRHVENIHYLERRQS